MPQTDTRMLTAPERHRSELVPVLVDVFAERGYRKATTAYLAERCGIQEVELYRAWPSKRDMFLAAIDRVFEAVRAEWSQVIEQVDGDNDAASQTAAQRLLSHQSLSHGDRGFYRIIFAGLSELDDPEIRRALRRLYSRFHGYVVEQVTAHREDKGQASDEQSARRDAWALVGLAAVCDIGRSLGMLGRDERRNLLADVGAQLLEAEQ